MKANVDRGCSRITVKPRSSSFCCKFLPSIQFSGLITALLLQYGKRRWNVV